MESNIINKYKLLILSIVKNVDPEMNYQIIKNQRFFII